MKSILVYTILFLTLTLPSSFAKDYFVSKKEGSDANNGSSVSKSFRSIRRAAKVVKAGDTVFVREGDYTGRIQIKSSGTADSPITFTNFDNETVKLIGDSKNGGPTLQILGNHIIIDGLQSKLFNPCQGKRNNQFNFQVTGDHVTIKNCRFVGTDGVKDWSPPCNGREGGIIVSGGDYAFIYNNYFSELSFQAIKFLDQGDNLTSYWRVKGNETLNIHSNGVFIESQLSTIQHGIIEENKFVGSAVSDGIQSNGNYKKNAEPANYGVIIQNNMILGNAENGIDLKGTRYYVIQNNILQGNFGDNDGFQDKKHDRNAFGAISRGSRTQAKDNIIRGNIVYDNHSGANTFEGYRVYNNTFINNNRDYTGPNTTKYRHSLIGISAGFNSDVKFINNIIGGHGGCDILINPASEKNFIDYNLYTNDAGSPKFCAWIDGEERKYAFDSWQLFLKDQNIQGKDIHSIVENPKFSNASSRHYGSQEKYNLNLFSSDSDAVTDKGGPLTIAMNSESESSVLQVEDGKFFSDGMAVTDGDTIMVGDNIAQIEKKEENVLYLDREISWAKGDPVIWCPGHECPDNGLTDIGAAQLKKHQKE